VIDEVPILAMLGAHAPAETRFLGASELRVKESDRLVALVEGIRALGRRGGRGSRRSRGRLVAASAAAWPRPVGITGSPWRSRSVRSRANVRSEVAGMEAAAVSFPDFVGTLRSLGAAIEVIG
jgi:3-phosphoshikimate 1-carboxyvinyltransferase